jgi:hypothetical protein
MITSHIPLQKYAKAMLVPLLLLSALSSQPVSATETQPPNHDNRPKPTLPPETQPPNRDNGPKPTLPPETQPPNRDDGPKPTLPPTP